MKKLADNPLNQLPIVANLLHDAMEELEKFNTQNFVDPQQHRAGIEKVRLARNKLDFIIRKAEEK